MVSATLLHVGLHKTASTSLQATCGLNRDLLESNGYHYPALFNSHGGVKTENHSIALFNIFSSSRLSYHQNAGKSRSLIESDVSVYRRLLLLALLKKNTLILSGEDVSDLSVNEQEELATYIGAFSGTLKTFAVVRSPYSLHCSAFSGMVNNGRDLKPGDFLSQLEKIKKLRASFRRRGNLSAIEFIPFSVAAATSQGAIQFILESMGMNAIDGLKFVVANEGFSNEQTRMQMAINSMSPRLIGRKVNKDWKCAPKVSGPKFLLSKRELSLIMPQLLDENKWFEEHLGKEFCDNSFPTCD